MKYLLLSLLLFSSPVFAITQDELWAHNLAHMEAGAGIGFVGFWILAERQEKHPYLCLLTEVTSAVIINKVWTDYEKENSVYSLQHGVSAGLGASQVPLFFFLIRKKWNF